MRSRREILRLGEWIVDVVPDGIRLAAADDEAYDVMTLGTAEADALGQALVEAADHVLTSPHGCCQTTRSTGSRPCPTTSSSRWSRGWRIRNVHG